ncbi:single-stranded DNA-binding protein [Stutzerimonas stutzeri]
MSTRWDNEGNLGADPEFKLVRVSGKEERALLQCSVYFDNPIPKNEGFEDRGGFWARVEWWHQNAEQFCALYKKGMRVHVQGTLQMEPFEDNEGEDRLSIKVRADRIAILPYRVESVVMGPARNRQREAEEA